MTIYFLNNEENILLNYEQIAKNLAIKVQLASKPTVKFISLSATNMASIQVSKDDIVCLGFGHHYNLDYVRNELPTQIDYFSGQGARVVLTTELRFFKADETYFDKTADDLMVQRLAYDHRLKVLDVYSYLNTWYQRTTLAEQQTALTLVPGFDDLYQLTAAATDALFTDYLTHWLQRRFFKKQFMQDYSYGASMYPEVWDDPTNEADMAHIHEIGMNTVRIGEFFWDKLEPSEGHYNMSYLTKLLTEFKAHKIKVILGIPSPTPPRWFTVKYPSAKLVNPDGVAEEHGSRQHVCTNNPIFRKKVYQLTYQIAKVAKNFDNVIAIQMDNEFKCHVDQCFCPTCQQLWPQWLQAKYGTIENLNQKWGTDIWSERYPDFDAVVLPRKTPFAHNTGLDNAFRLFTADTLNDFASGIAQILIAETDIPVTHNTSLNFNLMNYELFSQLDLVGFDTYPMYNQYWNFPINLDLWRNLKHGDEVLLLETGASHVGYVGNYVTPHPKGYLPTEIFLGYAAGLKAFMYWPYRAQPSGVEQTHGAVVTQVGTPDLGYSDVLAGQKLLAKYEPYLRESKVKKSKVAIVYSDQAKRYMHVETGGIYEYRKTFTEFYRAVVRRGIAVELIPDNADFSQFECVLVPFMHAVSDSLLAKMKAFAKTGGKLILGPMTGDRTADMGWIRGENALGKLGEWLELKDEVQYLSNDEMTKAQVKVGSQTDDFSDLVTLFKTDHRMANVKTVAAVADDRSIVYQRDNVMYIGGTPKDLVKSPFWDELIKTQIKPFDDDHHYLEVETGIFKYRRENSNEIQFYLANMSSRSVEYRLSQTMTDFEGDQLVPGKYHLASYEYKLLRVKKVG